MPNSRSNKENKRENTGVVRGVFPVGKDESSEDTRKVEVLVEEGSIGGKLASARKKRKNTLESIMKGEYD